MSELLVMCTGAWWLFKEPDSHVITKGRQYYRQNDRKNEGSSNMGSVLLQPAQLYVLGLPALHLLVMLHVVTNVVLNLQVNEGIVLT